MVFAEEAERPLLLELERQMSSKERTSALNFPSWLHFVRRKDAEDEEDEPQEEEDKKKKKSKSKEKGGEDAEKKKKKSKTKGDAEAAAEEAAEGEVKVF